MSIDDQHEVIPCELCCESGGEILWRNDFCRVILVKDADYPGFCRVILNRHAKEMTDLSGSERTRLMNVVFSVEQVIRNVLQPRKVNLASLGNMTPHIHWHIIPRFTDDPHFPYAIWGTPQRSAVPRVEDISTLRRAVIDVLGNPE